MDLSRSRYIFFDTQSQSVLFLVIDSRSSRLRSIRKIKNNSMRFIENHVDIEYFQPMKYRTRNNA